MPSLIPWMKLMPKIRMLNMKLKHLPWMKLMRNRRMLNMKFNLQHLPWTRLVRNRRMLKMKLKLQHLLWTRLVRKGRMLKLQLHALVIKLKQILIKSLLADPVPRTILACLLVASQTMGDKDEQPIDVGSGPSTHDKNNRKKRMAKVPAANPRERSRRTPFIKIGGFYVGYKKFLACLKPHGDMNDEVMSLCIDRLNMASYEPHNRATVILFVAIYKESLIKQDPSIFQPNALMAELESDATHVTILVNVMCTFSLKKQANNLITNFITLTQECDAFNVNVASFTRADLEDYPKQNNLCDCGFFVVKYAENFDGKAMKGFEQQQE
ncbi:hypothetical protein D1007_51334 [Hordeum vulgare]|nr:hypothetical protein D1007_51334 [Hordeum vulgare]